MALVGHGMVSMMKSQIKTSPAKSISMAFQLCLSLCLEFLSTLVYVAILYTDEIDAYKIY